jgi:hypothetical protein
LYLSQKGVFENSQNFSKNQVMVPIYIKKLTSLENEVASNIPSLRPF